MVAFFHGEWYTMDGIPHTGQPKAAGVRKLGAAAEAFLRRESRYTDLYMLACPGTVPPGTEFTTDPVML